MKLTPDFARRLGGTDESKGEFKERQRARG